MAERLLTITVDFVVPENIHWRKRKKIIELMEEAELTKAFHEFAEQINQHIDPNVLRSITSEH